MRSISDAPASSALADADLPSTLRLLTALTQDLPEPMRNAAHGRIPVYSAFVESPKFAALKADDTQALQLKRWILRDWLAQQIRNPNTAL